MRNLIAIIAIAICTPLSAGELSLTWTGPTQRISGEPYDLLTENAGFKVHCREDVLGSPWVLIQDVPVPDAQSATFTFDHTVCAPNNSTALIAVQAYDTEGRHSEFSTAKKIQFIVPKSDPDTVIINTITFTYSSGDN